MKHAASSLCASDDLARAVLHERLVMADAAQTDPIPAEKPPSANANLAIRLATAAVGAPLIVALLYKGPAWGFYLLVLPATLIAAWELFNMTHPEDRLS